MNFSKQREQILQEVKCSKEHPCAEDIYRKLRENQPKLSLGTVYRNLNVLSDMGMIRRLPGIGSVDRFDGDTSNHVHYVCQGCGKIIDHYLDFTEHMREILGIKGTIEKLDAVAYGICDDCHSKKEEGEH